MTQSIYGPSPEGAVHKLIYGEKRGSVTYSTDRENEVSKISLILYLCCLSDGLGKHFYFRRCTKPEDGYCTPGARAILFSWRIYRLQSQLLHENKKILWQLGNATEQIERIVFSHLRWTTKVFLFQGNMTSQPQDLEHVTAVIP